MNSKKLVLCMLFGFALVCSTNLLCFFPQTLIQVPPLVYRLYNLTVILSIVGGSLLGTVFSLSRLKRPEKAMLVIGYVSLALGMTCSFFVGDGSDDTLVILMGIFCGLGIGQLMVCWFSFLALIPERFAMLTQGGQALLGTLFFVLISYFLPHFTFLAALGCLTISALLALLIYRRGNVPDSSVITQDSLKSSLRVLSNKGDLGRSFTFSLFAFVVISLLLGIVTAVIMSPEGSANALDQSVWGAIIGAGVFLLWAALSKKRNYGFMIKAFFGIFAFVLILPIEGHGAITSAGYQLICLLYFSLVIDIFSLGRRTLLFMLSLSYALTRGISLLGLYIPGRFGVLSYADFFSSVSLLFFIVYLVFIVILIVLNREKEQSASLGTQRGTQRGIQPDSQADESGVALDQGEESKITSEAFKVNREKGAEVKGDSPSVSLKGDSALASAVLGKNCGLTKRETEVLSLLARGRDAAYICKELYLSRNTVKSYMKSIYAKLGVHSQQELIDMVDDVACSMS